MLVSAGLLLVLLVIVSCSGNGTETPPRPFEGYGLWMDTVIKTQEKVIRGIEPGMTAEEVKKAETVSPAEEDSASLYYEMRADSVTEVSVTYQLAGNKVDEIEMMIRTATLDRATTVFNDLIRYFESKYSKPVSEKGIYVYSTKTSAGEPVRISLEDRSGVDDGLVYVLVYRDK